MNRINVTLMFVLIFVFATSIYASEKNKDKKFREVEDNLIEVVNTDNLGLHMSCSYFLGEIKSHRATNSLLKMLKSGDTEEERIIAALSLCKIGSEQGLFAVKQRIKFDESERVQRICEIFYNSYLTAK